MVRARNVLDETALGMLYPELGETGGFGKQSAYNPKKEDLYVYVVPDLDTIDRAVREALHKDVRLILAMELLSRHSGEWGPAVSVDMIRNWMATMIELVFPGLISNDLKLTNKYNIYLLQIDEESLLSASLFYPAVQVPPLPRPDIDVRGLYPHLGCENDQTAHPNHGTSTPCRYHSEHLPPPTCPYQHVANVAEDIPAYANLSVLLFTLGKQATEANLAAFHTNRPRALIGKYQLLPSAMKLWNGERKPSLAALKKINAMWTTCTNFRRPIATELALWANDEDTSTGQEIISTTYNLLRWQGMGHVAMIKDLILSWPDIKSIPDLIPFIEVYMDSSRKILTYPNNLRPFAKIIAGDRLKIFRQQDIKPLTALAYLVARQNNPTLVHYVHDTAFDKRANEHFQYLLTLKNIVRLEETPEAEGLED